MISRQTWVSVSDNTTVKWLQVFHLYKGFIRKSSPVGFFLKGSARVVSPPRIEYKGFKLKYNTKGDICRGLIIRGTFHSKRLDGAVVFFPVNNIVLIKKQQNIKSKYVLGPVEKTLKRKKFKTFFKSTV